MTIDQAIEIMRAISHEHGRLSFDPAIARLNLRIFEALGMLKLESPKDLRQPIEVPSPQAQP